MVAKDHWTGQTRKEDLQNAVSTRISFMTLHFAKTLKYRPSVELLPSLCDATLC